MNSVSLTFLIDFQLQHVADLGEDVVGEGGQEGDALQEVQLVLHLLDAGSLHDLLEHDALHAPKFPVSDGLDGGCPLAVVEDRQLSKCFANPQSAEDLAILDDFIFSLGRDVDVGPELPCKMIARL